MNSAVTAPKRRIDPRTLWLMAAAAVVLLCANALPLKIPFVGEQETDGYMIKQGWPCAFREQTRHRVFWEWRDVSIDSVTALVILLAIGVGAEFCVRGRWPIHFRAYCMLVVLAALVVALNLHEHSDVATTERGWPMTALTRDPHGVHHNRIEPLGLTIDFVVGAALIGAAVAGLARFSRKN